MLYFSWLICLESLCHTLNNTRKLLGKMRSASRAWDHERISAGRWSSHWLSRSAVSDAPQSSHAGWWNSLCITYRNHMEHSKCWISFCRNIFCGFTFSSSFQMAVKLISLTFEFPEQQGSISTFSFCGISFYYEIHKQDNEGLGSLLIDFHFKARNNN